MCCCYCVLLGHECWTCRALINTLTCCTTSVLLSQLRDASETPQRRLRAASELPQRCLRGASETPQMSADTLGHRWAISVKQTQKNGIHRNLSTLTESISEAQFGADLCGRL